MSPTIPAPRRHAKESLTTSHLLIFEIEGQRYALGLDAVQSVVRAAAITPLPSAPEIVLGLLDLHGEVMPVIDLRRRFRLRHRELCSEDQFIIARTQTRTLALVVDGTDGVRELADLEMLAPDDILAGMGFLEGVTRTAEGLVLVHDLESLLFAEEAAQLDRALEEAN